MDNVKWIMDNVGNAFMRSASEMSIGTIDGTFSGRKIASPTLSIFHYPFSITHSPLSIIHYPFLCVLIFLFAQTFIFADDLSQRERELSEMQIMIEQQRQSAIEAEQRRQSAISDREHSETQLTTAQRRMQELNNAQQNLQRSLDHSSQLMRQAENKLTQLQGSINHTMLFLLFSDIAETKLKQKDSDTLLLSVYLQGLFRENSKLDTEMTAISRERQTREREFTDTQNRSRAEQNRVENIATDIRRLETDIEVYERQREDFLLRASELERTAIALQDLINYLREQSARIVATYEFPNGYEAPLRGRIITHFGTIRHERYNIQTISNGINIATPENTMVRAFAEGEVVYSDVFTGSGRMIIIDHKNGFHTVYGYNNELLVQKGDFVSRGQVIARSGKTGAAIEPSLHFEIRKSGQPVNPLDFIRIQN